MKKVFLIVLILVILAAIAGGYYYFEIYQPKQYVEAATSLFENDLSLFLNNFSEPEIKNSGDYQSVLEAASQEKIGLEQVQNKLSALKPSGGAMKRIHQDFSAFLEKSLATASVAERNARFFSNALNFLKVFRPEIPPPYSSAPPVFSGFSDRATVNQALIIWRERLPKVKAISRELFEQEPLELKEVSFSQLKSLWQDSEKGLDLMMALLQNSDPALYLDRAKLAPGNEEGKKEAANIDKAFDEFPPLLASAIYANTARDIFSEAVSNEELNKQIDELNKKIQELKNELEARSYSK